MRETKIALIYLTAEMRMRWKEEKNRKTFLKYSFNKRVNEKERRRDIGVKSRNDNFMRIIFNISFINLNFKTKFFKCFFLIYFF